MLTPVLFFVKGYRSNQLYEVPLTATDDLITRCPVNRNEILEAMSFLPSFVNGEMKTRLETEFADATKHPNTTASFGIVFRDGHHYVRYRVGFDFKTDTAISERIITSAHEDFHPHHVILEHKTPEGIPSTESVFAGLDLATIADHYDEDCACLVETLRALPARIEKAKAH